MEVKLIVVNEKASVKELVLGPETYIGRSPKCQLRIASTRVSRKHCVITVTDREVTVRDLGSANGTVLDGLTVASGVAARVRPGSKLIVGPLKFVFDFDPPEPMQPPAGYVSPTDILALAGQPGDEDDTKDYVPRGRKQPAAPDSDKPADKSAGSKKPRRKEASTPSGADAPAGSPAPPVASLPPLNPDDTVFDAGLADHAREAARRARDDADSVLSESGTDLLADEPTPVIEQGSAQPRGSGDVADDPALNDFLKQFD